MSERDDGQAEDAMAVKVKICGVTRASDARLASQLGADLIGLNFHPPSPRYLAPERALEVRQAVAGHAGVVGVFVNAERESIERMLKELALDFLQFHGDEDDNALAGWPVPVIRAYRLRPGDGLVALRASRADYILIDSYAPALYGGTGHAFELQMLAGIDLSRALLSGGLTPESVAQAVALAPWGVDVASGVESAPGLKDPVKLRSFILHAKSSR